MKATVFIFLFLFAHTASAAIFINEIQISPINERFIELYNSENFDVDLTGWYLQRKTATGSSFGSLITSTQLNSKVIKAYSYFLISRSQLENSDVVVDLTLTESNTVRIRDSKGKDVDQLEWGSIGEGKSYQRISAGEWINASPTPGRANSGASAITQSTSNTQTVTSGSSAPASRAQAPPAVSVKAVSEVRVVLAGAPVVFEGKISGVSSGTARTTWSFGDGAEGVGESVTHTYYYPGEYTVVIDVVSGNLVATDKMLVRVVLPNLTLRSEGDTLRSFVTIENKGGEELDMSGWQIVSNDKKFTFPSNTILGARKSATFASEVTGLSTPTGDIPELRFPNGSPVEIKNSTVSTTPASLVTEKQSTKFVATKSASPKVMQQQAAVLGSVPEAEEPTQSEQTDGGLWPWYIGAAFLGALALVGVRLTQKSEGKATITADDFEIVEEIDNKEPH